MEKKKVIIITSEIYPYHSTGGLGIAISRMVIQLVNLGIEVNLIIPVINDAKFSIKHNLIKYYKLSVPLVKTEESEDSRIKWNILFEAEVLKVINKIENCSLIILNDNETASLVKSLKNYGIKTPILFWLHSFYDYPSKNKESLLGTAVDFADWVAVSSGVIKDVYQLEFPIRLTKLQNALIQKYCIKKLVFPNSLGCIPNYNNKEILKINKRKLRRVILFSGRTSFTKGLGFIFDLAEKLQNIGWKLRITGKSNSELCATNYVEYVGWLDQEKLFEEYINADIIIVPSLTEGFGLCVAEALRFNCKVLAFPIGGIQDLITENNLTIVELTKSERELLYWLWSKMIDSLTEQDIIWNKYKYKLKSIQEKLNSKTIELIREIEKSKMEFKNHTNINNSKNNWGSIILKLLNKID